MALMPRQLTLLAKAATESRHYVALWNAFRVLPQPLAHLRAHALGSGTYPAVVTVNTASGLREIFLNSSHDRATFNAIFLRKDYPAPDRCDAVADFGSNIGISAAYFASVARAEKVYCFEPNPANLETFRRNTRGLESQIELSTDAVGTADGIVEFGTEPTGRYGGIGKASAQTIQVKCRNATGILEDIIRKHGKIGVLKIDVEGLEADILKSLSPQILEKISEIYIEWRHPLEVAGFTARQYGIVRQYKRA